MTLRRKGKAVAEQALQTLYHAGIIACDDSDEAFWKAAATFKAHHAVAFPDGFCLALAQRLNATVVTTDHAEFDPLVSLNYCPLYCLLVFIR